MKTKLGISAGLLGATMYFFGLFSGYVALAVLVGYVLLKEENEWLRRTAVKSMVLSLSFSVLFAVIGLVPDFLQFIGSVFNVFNSNFNYSIVTKLVQVVTNALGIIQTAVFLLLGLKALHQGDMKLGRVDKSVDAHMSDK